MAHKTYKCTLLGPTEDGRYASRYFEHKGDMIAQVSQHYLDSGLDFNQVSDVQVRGNDPSFGSLIVAEPSRFALAFYITGTCDCGVTDEDINRGREDVAGRSENVTLLPVDDISGTVQ
jgi:hypothetical protein